MKLSKKFIAVPALALAAGLSLAACSSSGGAGTGGGAPASGSNTSAPAAQKTLTRIQKSGAGNSTWYHNYWSDGSVTTCTVMSGVFADGAQSATGNCAPDGIANGISGGNAAPN
jgi:hypothetical protein